MERFDCCSIINDFQNLIYSLRDTNHESEAVLNADRTRANFVRSTEEFVKPAVERNADGTERKDGHNLDRQLELLRLENRQLTSEMENVQAMTAHVQQSHRMTMAALMRDEVPTPSGWEPSGMREQLTTDLRVCEVESSTPTEEEERLKMFAGGVRALIIEESKRHRDHHKMLERVAFENHLMRALLTAEDPSKVGGGLLQRFKDARSAKRDSVAVVKSVTLEEMRKLSRELDRDFWSAHGDDLTAMEEKEEQEKEQEEEQAAKDRSMAARRTESDIFGSSSSSEVDSLRLAQMRSIMSGERGPQSGGAKPPAPPPRKSNAVPKPAADDKANPQSPSTTLARPRHPINFLVEDESEDSDDTTLAQ